MYALNGGASSLTQPEACCNYYQYKVDIFATVFLVSLILCFGLGAGGIEDLQRCLILIKTLPNYVSTVHMVKVE